MASDNEACCESDPNFAVICGFLEKFGVTCGLANIDFLDLQDMLENSQEVPQELVDLHVKLLRKARKSVSSERWERAIIKLCHGFCSQDAWEIERFGYKKARLSSKLRILKELLEMQFDYNAKFKNEVNKLSADELRTQPLGRDRLGHIYWFQSDNSCQIRVYKEDPDEETWALVAKNREGLVDLITQLNDGNQTVVNEDSNSLESEKPVVDTGQSDSNSNSNSSKQEPVESNLNPEEVQANTNKEEIEVEQPQVKSEEENAPNHAEVIKPTKIKLIGNKAIISDDLNKMAEPDNAITNIENNGNSVEEESKSESSVEKDEKDSKPLLTVTPPKTGISIRIKPIMELISPSTVEVNKKVEITGVKEKYIRSDSTSSSSVHHRKAVDSAGFDVHTNYLKRPIDEEEDVEEPSYVKRPRLDRPTLLSNKKKKPYSDEEEDDEDDEEVSDEVKEPLMLVQGEGSGRDNETANSRMTSSDNTEEDSPIVGEAVEEEIVFFYGEGSGHECETGNDNNADKKDAQQQNKSDADSTSGPSKLNPDDKVHEENKAEIVDSIKDSEPSNSFNENDSVKLSTKPEYKLGTIIDVRTNNLLPCVKNVTKKSRWDIGKPEEEIIESQSDGKASVIEEISDNICLAEEKLASLPLENVETKESQTLCNNNELLESETLKELDIREKAACDTNSVSCLNVDGLPPVSMKVAQEIGSKCEEEFSKNKEGQMVSSTEENKNENIDNIKTDTNSPDMTPKKSMFFFGPGCLQVKPTISPLKDDHSLELPEDSVEVDASPTKEIVNQDSLKLKSDDNVELKLETGKKEGNYNLVDTQHDISALNNEKNEEKEVKSVVLPVGSNETFTEVVVQERTVGAVDVKSDYDPQEFKKLSSQKSGEVPLKSINSPKMLDNETDLLKGEGSSLAVFKIPDSKKHFENLTIAENIPKLSEINQQDESTKAKIAQHVLLQNFTETSQTAETEKNTLINELELSAINQPATDEHAETKLTITNNSSEMVLKEDTNEPQVTKESPEIQKVEFINDDGQSNKLVAIKNSCSEQIKVNSAKEPLDIAADITESSPNFFKADPQTSKVEIIHDVLGVTSQNQSKSDMEGVIDHDSTKCNTNVEEPTEEDTREVLSATVVEAQVNKMHSSVPTSIKPANHHVPKSSISVSEKEIENLRTNSRKTGDKGGGSELNDVPVVDKPFSSHSSTHVENKKREKIVEATSLPICKNQVENLGITVKENKPKSKLENVLEKINQVKLIQKTDSIELNIKNKESLSLESKLKPHSTLLDSKTTSIEAQMAIITGEGLPDEHSIDSEMPKSSDIKIPSDIEVPTTSKLDIIAALDNQNSTKNMIFATTLNSSITKEVAKVEVTACGNSSSDLEVKSVDTVLEASTKIVFPTNTDMPEEVSIKSTNTLCDIKENADVKPSTALSEVNKHVINQQTVDVPEQLGNTSISKLVTDKVVQNTIQQASVNSSPTSPVTKQVDAKTKPIDASKNEQSNINKLNEMLDETSGDNKAQSDLEDLISKNSVLDKTLPSVDESKNHVKELVADTSHKNILISKDIESNNTSTSDVKVTSKNNSAELALSSIKSPEQKIEIRQEVSIPENLLTVKKPEKTFVCTGSSKQLEAAIISDKPVIASTDKSVIGDSTIKLTTTKIVSTADVKTDNATLFNKQSLDTSAPTISDTTTTCGDTIVLDKPVVACTNKSTILQVTTPTKPAKYAKNVKKDNSDEQSLDITPSSSAITKELKDTTTSNKPIVISTDKSATLKDAIQCTPTKFVQAEDVKKDNSSLSDEHSLPTIPSSSVDVNSTVITKELKASVISDKPIITCTDKSVVLKDVIKSTPIKQGKAENVNKDNSALSSECSLDTTPSSTVSDVPTVITKELKDGITFNKPVTTSDECSIIKPTPTKLGRAETVKQDDSALSDKDSLDTIPSSSVCDTSIVITKELKAISADKSSILRIENVKKEDSALSDTPTSSIDYTTKVITKELKNIDKPVATLDDKSAVLKDTSKSTLTKPVQAENVKKDSLTLSDKNSLDQQTHNVGDTPARITEELKDTVVTSIGKSAVLKVTNKAIPTKPLKAEDVKKDDSTSSAKNSPDRLTFSIGDTPTILAGELKEATISNKPVATSADESAVVKDAIKMVSAKPMQTEDVMKKDDSALSKMVSAKPEDVIKKDDSALSQTISAKPEDVMQKDGSPVSKTISAKPVQAKDVMKKDDSALSKTVSAKPVQAKDVMKKDDSALSKTISAKPVQAKDIMKKDDSAASKTISATPVQAKDIMKKDDSALSNQHSLDQPGASVGDAPAVIAKEVEDNTVSDKPVVPSIDKPSILKDTIKSTPTKPSKRKDIVKKDNSTVSDKRSRDTSASSVGDTPTVISKELEKTIILDSPTASTDKSATLKEVIKSATKKPGSSGDVKKDNSTVSGKRLRSRTSTSSVGNVTSVDNSAVTDLPTDNFPNKIRLNKRNKQSLEKVCESKPKPPAKVVIESSRKVSTSIKNEKSEVSSEKSLNEKELLQTKVEAKTSVLGSSSDNLSKSDSKNDNIKAVVQSEEKILSRRITRRTRSSTLEKPPEVVSSVNKEVSSVENVISTSLSKLEETKIKANLPQVCITKIDINDLNENASISIANIEKSAGIAESGTELRKRGRVATQPQNSDIKPRPRGRPSLKKNKLLTENSEELKTPTDEEKSAKPVPKSNKKEVEVVGGNIRELRGRKGMEKSKVNETEEKKTKGKQLKGKLAVKTPAKEGSNTRGVGRPKGKNNNETPSKPNEPNEVRSFTRSRAQITKDKEITSKIETGQENTKKPENTNSEQNVDLGDIEEQIVRNEIRPSKKLKLADSVEVTVIDKNKRTVTTHVADKNKAVEKVADKNKTVEKVADKNKAVEKVAAKEETEDKKEPVKLRRTSNRLSVSGKTESSEKNSKDQNTSIKQEERLHGSEDKKVDVEKQEPKTKSSESKEDNSEELKPVVEPKCIQKKVALLTSVENKVEEQKNDSKCELLDNIKDDIKEKIDVTPETNADVEEETSNIKTKSDDMKEELENIPDSDVSDGIAGDCGDSSDGMGVIPESDPLGGSDEDSKGSTKNSEPMTLATFKIDLDESSPASIMRVTRKRAAQQSIDALRETRPRGKAVENESKNIADNKRAKLKRKRSVDRNLRRSIEEKKSKEISSSEEDAMGKMSPQSLQLNKEEHGKKSKAVVKRRISTRSTRTTESPALSSDAPSEASRTDTSNTPPVTKQRKPRRSKKTLLGLEISPETEDILKNDTLMGVRQSRRIAQIKIKEEAERRKLEEVTLYELKEEQRKRKGKKDEDKDYKLEKHKRNKIPPTEDETTTGDAESDEKKKRKRKRKHRDPRKHFDALNPWKSSSGSSSSEVEEEEDEIEEEDDSQLVFKSDHEFSPESDLEEGGEVQPLKRARTARKESDAEEEVDDCACQKCGQKDHPEWILLCDSCDCGWHCSCLRPALLVIPEGDWFCPPCQHITLVKNLETQLLEYDKRLNKKEMETRRKERLAYVGISLDNVLPSKESEEYRIKRQHQEKENHRERNYSNSDSDDSGSDSDSSSNSSSDSEPIYQLRERRQAHSYRFNDYDELINSAIQDELDAVKGAGNQGRGKDIATIVNAEKEEEALRLQQETTSEAGVTTTDGVAVDPVEGAIVTSETGTAVPEPLPPVVPVDYDKKPEDSDDEIIRPVRKIIGKKKHRKLNSLDVSSGDDAESDEDFKGSSSSDSEEDFDDDEYTGTDSSGDRRGKRRKDFGPVRRSTRARISRYDRDFINDDDTDSDDAPRRKKTRSVWDESESEESDRSWGRRKRKAKKSSRKKPSSKVKKSKKKKKKRDDDSDPEVYRKRPNIKFGGLNDDEEIGRRTRGKKINYLEALGTDSEEEIRKKPPRIEESEEEYFLHEDADFQHQLEDDKDSDESGVDAVLQDLAVVQHATSKPRGRGKSGLKIPRKPKEPPPPDLFPPLMPDVPQLSNLQAPSIPTEPTLLQPLLTQQPLITQPPLITQSLLLEPPMLHEHDLQEIEDEPNPIEQINKNVEQMNEQEMEKMMEEEDYANKQLQLVALQIEKEKKRKEREAKRLEKIGDKEQKIPKKRGRKPKSQTLGISTDLVPPFSDSTSLLLNSTMANNAELSEPPGVNLPMFSEIAPVLNADGSPKKRRGRESPLHGSKLGIATPPQPFSQSQPTPSVITRMLQSQPGQGNFPAGVAKYFGGPPGDPQLGPPTTSPYHPGATGPRGQIPGPYQQPPGMSHYPVVRSGPPPPHRLHSPGPPALPPMYHTHRSLDPSPSGGGPINVPANNRDRHSPAVVPPASSSPLSKGDPTPPPPPYTRPQVGHFPPVTGASSLAASGSRHIPMVAPHLQQHRTSSMSPYHPGVPPNYHYGSYPPPPPLNSEEGQPPPGYPSSAYPEPYPAEGAAPVQPPEGSGAKSFDEETSGEFVGLVSYFSSQREDDLDT